MTSQRTENSAEISPFYGFRGNGLVTGLTLRVRKQIYDLFMQEFPSALTIADVGVTSEQISPEANVLEALYPHKERITALGVENAQHLEEKFKGIKFQKIEAGKPLPFADNAFDVVYSHAVIEHVVDPQERLFFLSEIVRIGRAAFITTPNKYFPIEPHTFTPLLHFIFPRFFYYLLRKKIINKFYNEGNLRLLDTKEFKALASRFSKTSFEIKKAKLFGMTSNLVLIIKKI